MGVGVRLTLLKVMNLVKFLNNFTLLLLSSLTVTRASSFDSSIIAHSLQTSQPLPSFPLVFVALMDEERLFLSFWDVE